MKATNNLQGFLRVNTKLDYHYSRDKNVINLEEKESKDGYVTKIIKYIPGEIVAAYLFATNMISSSQDLLTMNKTLWLWIVFFFILVLTPVYRWRVIRIAGLGWDKSALVQALIATLAFVAWAFALGGPFKEIGFLSWNVTIANLILMAATLTFPLLEELLLPINES